MASNNTYSHSINLRYILENQKLSGENFLDWEKNLRIVLDCERKLYILETDPPKTPKANARASELTSFKKYEDDARDVKCIIMASMTAELQRLHADMEARPMIQRLRDLLQGHPKNSGIYVIEVNMSDFTSWVMDTGCGSHICTSMQNLHEVRHLTEGEVQLKVGNGALVNALAVGTYVLSLPSGLLLHLNNCLFVPAISRNIISVSFLDKAGFSINVKDKCLSVFRNDIYYATAKMTNGLYILDLDATVYNVDVKRSKPNSLNLTYLWHCRLGHINKKRISKLCHSGVLDSFDLESYDVCQSCLLGKMTKAPFTGHGERASDVLGLIHSDVCGPINTEARGGFSYFETKGYEFYHPTNNKIFVARNGTFLEKEFLSAISSGRKVDLEEIREPQEEISTAVEPERQDLVSRLARVLPRRSDRMRNPPVRYGFLVSDEGDVLLVDQGEPETYLEAITCLESEQWLNAMKSEMESMYTNQVWTLVDAPEGIKPIGESVIVFLILYVDDILLMGNDVPALTSVKTWLSENFAMKDLGNASYALGIRIYRDRSRKLIGLCQSTYIYKVLNRFSMFNSKKGSLPMIPGTALSKSQSPSTPEQKELMMKVPYASAIGSIMYAMICTRPDVSFALSVTSRYQGNPGEAHWTAVKNILKYLRNTKDAFLVYGGEKELKVIGYTDASFQTDRDNYKSQAGYVFCLNGGAFSWKSSKQDTTADSTTEAEYMAAAEAAKEGVWIKKFISELGVVSSINDPIPLFCDNTGAIAQTKEPRSHQKTKHIVRRYHIIREIVDRGDVEICKVGTDDNIADPLTKPLGKLKHEGHTKSMGIRPMPDWP
ncbi:unnamed protein product [Cuscuta campestris]|uniref:GAG-pre-integrase domain-containing protein n=1 Tax=Cuscuta campestris TaxID=132261 RepID=A0A484M7A7_9ASTE|nr:unnamed protein product [Cuscuta campestris]